MRITLSRKDSVVTASAVPLAVKEGKRLDVSATVRNVQRVFTVVALDAPQRTNDGLQVPFSLVPGMPDSAGDGIGFAVWTDNQWNLID